MRMRLPLIAAAFAFATVALPAVAVPEVSIDGVWAEDCSTTTCGNGDAVTAGGHVRGPVTVAVSAESLSPLEWLRLEGRAGDDLRWVCLQHWTTGATQSFDASFVWQTREWPDPAKETSDCLENAQHYHGRQTTNDVYTLRVVARERGVPGQSSSERDGFSAPFEIVIDNPPTPPEWVADPTVSGRSVTLQWRPNGEPDIKAYSIVRAGPTGEERIHVDAGKPRAHGCQEVGGVALKCVDRDVPGTGEFTYSIVAWRGTVDGESCPLSKGRCTRSAPSEPRNVIFSSSGGTVERSSTEAQPSTPPSPAADPAGDDLSPPAPTTDTVSGGTTSVAAGPSPAEPLPGRSPYTVAAFVAAVGLLAWRVRRALVARR